ncbi:endonuclease/exonuclease/phosphatase family protein [Paenibacillus sepulcri]|uniref:Endonuclease/exonuclease/phosphatase family protein n=1 Tax=Paenibacillus sepulcri TaxID=359917 RepID=A0ABS7BW18_9BACL|nr:endonuclease/exonuclease/phosphatase family protein [Paenibacillus sepulcri]
MELKVMTFNLRINVKQDGANAWPNRVSEVAEVIHESRASIICTQEGSYAMLKELERLLPDYAWVGEGRQGGQEDEHNAIFYLRSSLEVLQSGTFGLSEYPEQLGFRSWNTACPRICTWVQLGMQGGKRLYIFNTHLDHVSTEARTKGIQLIMQRIGGLCREKGIHAVLAGDFNSYPESDVITILNDTNLINVYAALTEKEVGSTYHGFEGGEIGEPIDYIYVTEEVQIASVLINRKKYEGRYPSDHYPVVASLRLN